MKKNCPVRKLYQKYGLSLKAYYGLWVRANGCCEICGIKLHSSHINGSEEALKEVPADEKSRACVDHCHSSGEVRGLLCIRCNAGIGYLRDDKQILLASISYLDKPTTGISPKAPAGKILETKKEKEIRERKEAAPYGLDNCGRPRNSPPYKTRRSSGRGQEEVTKIVTERDQRIAERQAYKKGVFKYLNRALN